MLVVEEGRGGSAAGLSVVTHQTLTCDSKPAHPARHAAQFAIFVSFVYLFSSLGEIAFF